MKIYCLRSRKGTYWRSLKQSARMELAYWDRMVSEWLDRHPDVPREISDEDAEALEDWAEDARENLEEDEYFEAGLPPVGDWWIAPEVARNAKYVMLYTMIMNELMAKGFSAYNAHMHAMLMARWAFYHYAKVYGAAGWGAMEWETFLSGAALVIAAIGAVALLIYVIIAPEKVGTIVEKYSECRYVMRYQERLYWATVIGKTPEGVPYYKRDGRVAGDVAIEERAEDWREGGNDKWTMEGYTVETWYDFPWWYTVEWEDVELNFIGMSHESATDIYRLSPEDEDRWTDRLEPGTILPEEGWDKIEPPKTVDMD